MIDQFAPCNFSCTMLRLETANGKYRSRGSTSEFGAVLIVFFLLILFPLMDLVALGVGAATLQLAAHESASHAAVCEKYSDALYAAANRCFSLARSNLGKFAKMAPVGGISQTGVHLFIVRTDYSTNQVQYCGPDSPAIPPVDTTGYVYEYMAILRYSVGPFVNLSFVPFLAEVPGLGKAAQLTFTSHSAVENPLGLSNATTWATLHAPAPGDGDSYAPDWELQRADGSVAVTAGSPKPFQNTLDIPSPW